MECKLNQPGSFWLRTKDRVFVGSGVLEEWKAETPEQAIEALDDMRECPGFKVGYLSYDFGVAWQGVKSEREDSFKTPCLHFVIPEMLGIFDVEDPNVSKFLEQDEFSASDPSQDLTEEEYTERINKIHQYLKDGETYEVNFAHRFSGTYEGNPLEVFRRLNEKNPSPHACYLNFDPITVVSCSPERLIRGREEDGRTILETRPIKGTVPRGENEEDDERLKEELLASKKNEAELNMIVDLARNDLGQVCERGSVEVDEHRTIETYSHVHHTMSSVRGVLREGLDVVDILKAVFPGGSITGAPKRRTMEIIDGLELCKRGIYTGSAGYIDENGQFDFNILIRTIAMQRDMASEVSGGQYSYHSGGGIVMDSTAELEYEETLAKAEVLRKNLSPDY